MLTQLAKVCAANPRCPPNIAEELQRVKWFLRHGNVFRARQTVDGLTTDITDVESGKLTKAVREFGGYLAANACAIPNYGERRLAGETISTSFVESAVNQVISKRMVKKQQMRWSPSRRAPTAPDPHPDPQRHNRSRAPGRVASHGLSRSPTYTHVSDQHSTYGTNVRHRVP